MACRALSHAHRGCASRHPFGNLWQDHGQIALLKFVGSQVSNRPARFGQTVTHQIARLVQTLTKADGNLRRVHVDRIKLQGNTRQILRQRVVDLAGDPVSLSQHCRVAGLQLHHSQPV